MTCAVSHLQKAWLRMHKLFRRINVEEAQRVSADCRSRNAKQIPTAVACVLHVAMSHLCDLVQV